MSRSRAHTRSALRFHRWAVPGTRAISDAPASTAPSRPTSPAPTGGAPAAASKRAAGTAATSPTAPTATAMCTDRSRPMIMLLRQKCGRLSGAAADGVGAVPWAAAS
ncbi:hypothetical protein [Nocardiopsis halophila]|uniref:hypothetical protein n=1 Tax=Nocardiopsis halophila TaxID=141692 RepID=UPI000367B982